MGTLGAVRGGLAVLVVACFACGASTSVPGVSGVELPPHDVAATEVAADSGVADPGGKGDVGQIDLEPVDPGVAELPEADAEADTAIDVPFVPSLCVPCDTDIACGSGGRCVRHDLTVPVCAPACASDVDCPSGTSCREAAIPGGGAASVCLPDDGCPCTEALLTVKVSCPGESPAGVCPAWRTCLAGGWSDCVAAVPADEVCNGVDDDCDGAADEDFPLATCGVGACLHTVSTCVNGLAVACDPREGAASDDAPDWAGDDADCDGFDGRITVSVFVDAASGSDQNPGTPDLPKRTIGAAFATVATNPGLRDVILSEGTYAEMLDVPDGVGLYGGYRVPDGWKRDPAAVSTVAGGVVGLRVHDVSKPTVVDGLRIEATANPALSGTSIGLWLARCTDKLTVRRCDIRPGNGGPGEAGAGGGSGMDGGAGAAGGNGCENDGGACKECSTPASGQGGTSACGRGGGSGGIPGHDDEAGWAGTAGCCDSPGGAGGGKKSPGQPGSNGSEGTPGTDGAPGDGAGSATETGFAVSPSSAGGPGGHGAGGGGGGGGGGGTAEWDHWCKDFGGAGGGGGGGGCGGTSGTPGTSGGASIAVFAWDCAALLVDNTLAPGKGGAGGVGGEGGAGGAGGGAGAGGQKSNYSGAGGPGGIGGAGGRGGHGAGGGGGPSLGAVCGGARLPTQTGTSFIAGQGGAGGGGPGKAGATGKVLERLGCP